MLDLGCVVLMSTPEAHDDHVTQHAGCEGLEANDQGKQDGGVASFHYYDSISAIRARQVECPSLPLLGKIYEISHELARRICLVQESEASCLTTISVVPVSRMNGSARQRPLVVSTVKYPEA